MKIILSDKLQNNSDSDTIIVLNPISKKEVEVIVLKPYVVIRLILGFVFLIMGAIGLLLPVWPTTPFVLLSVACFSKAPRIKSKIMKIKFFREHVENYENRNGLSRKTFCISMTWLWGMLLLSMVLTQQITMTFLLSIIGVAVTIHIAWMSRRKVKEQKK